MVMEVVAGINRVLQQHGYRHRTDTAGHGSNPGRVFTGGSKVHVTDQLAGLGSIDPHVNHRGAGFDPVSVDHAGFADRDDDDFRLSHFMFQVPCETVTDGHGGMASDKLTIHCVERR